jgi:transposase
MEITYTYAVPKDVAPVTCRDASRQRKSLTGKGLGETIGDAAPAHFRSRRTGAPAFDRYLPPYSPDFNPIEKAFAKLKAFLRKAAERTVEGLWSAIGRCTDLFKPSECQNYFALAGCDAL